MTLPEFGLSIYSVCLRIYDNVIVRCLSNDVYSRSEFMELVNEDDNCRMIVQSSIFMFSKHA